MEAAASGFQSTRRTPPSRLGPQLGLEGGLDALDGLGRNPVLQRHQFLADGRRHQVGPGGGDLAHLDVDAAGFFDHPSETDAG